MTTQELGTWPVRVDAEPVDELDARSLGEGGTVRLVHHLAFGPMIEVYFGSESIGADLRFPVPAALALDAFRHPFAYAEGRS